MTTITEQMLEGLRERVMRHISPKRFRHTLAVEEMVARLCALYCPEYTVQLRAAALLHDLTKELEPCQQESLCREYGLPVGAEEKASPKLYHARTAAEKIRVEFAEFADPVVISAVRWHTTGHTDMTLPEKLLYLADYIDESRTFRNCVILRRYFFGAQPETMTPEEREALLRETLILSYDMTIGDLLAEGRSVALDTVQARNELIFSAMED